MSSCLIPNPHRRTSIGSCKPTFRGAWREADSPRSSVLFEQSGSANKRHKTDQATFGLETGVSVTESLLGLDASLRPIGQPQKLVDT